MICLLWFNALSCFFHMFTEVGGEKRERKQAVLKYVTDSCMPQWFSEGPPLLHNGVWLSLRTTTSNRHVLFSSLASFTID